MPGQNLNLLGVSWGNGAAFIFTVNDWQCLSLPFPALSGKINPLSISL